MTKKLSIIIPCYNERETIRELLHRVEQVQLPGSWEKEIIVVDDGSHDGTRDILAAYQDHIKVILQEKNGGKGSAVRQGLQEATGQYALIQDADLEYDPNEIPSLIRGLEEGKGNVIYGSRNLSKKKREGFLIPRAGVWAITRLLNLSYGLSLTDAWTCYKLFPASAARDFRAGGFESELLFTAALARRGLSIGEVPISHNPRPVAQGKKITYRDGIHAVLALAGDRLLYLRKPIAYVPKDVSKLLCCPFCGKMLQSSSSVPYAGAPVPMLVSVNFLPQSAWDSGYVCAEHGSFAVDSAGRPLLISQDALALNTEEHVSGVNWLKSFLKQFPKLYYGIWHLFCPVLMIRNGPRKILPMLPDGPILLDVGSGPERLGEEFINIDVYPFPQVDVVADASALPFPAGTADGVVSESLLEHVADPVKVAAEMSRVLKPGGLLYVSAPFVHPYHASPDDFNRWTVSGLKQLFPDLEIIESGVRSGPWSAFLMFLAYWLGVIFAFGSKKIAPVLAHVFMLVLGPLKYLDLLFMSMPGADAVAAHLYIIGKKK
ncbi:MAG: glycosyltransferase [Candidatus Sungbacteria bacterium]|nr:glycosyltransferase [Candidatus Sungbacteria bacterium]